MTEKEVGEPVERTIQLHAHVTNGDALQAGRDLHIYNGDGARRVRPVLGAEKVVCPYPGLAPFGAEYREWFYGRDQTVAEVCERLDSRLHEGGPLVLIGPSGAGKSSLLAVGVLPALSRGALPVAGSNAWPQLRLTPTASPSLALAAATGLCPEDAQRRAATWLADGSQVTPDLLAIAGKHAAGTQGGRSAGLVVVVDQFEELFTACADEAERQWFIDVLDRLAQRPIGAAVMLGVRADFYAACTAYPQLRDALRAGPVLLDPMTEVELKQAIRQPAHDVGLDIEDALVEKLLADLGASSGLADAGSAGRLPLLAHALRATWMQRSGHTMTVDGYRLTGGIRGAIAKTADRVFDDLGPQAQEAARWVFLRLVNVGRDADDTRRIVRYDDLLRDAPDAHAAAVVVDCFTAGRLLTRDQDVVAITHEVLIRAWPQLRAWTDQERAGNLLRQDLEEAAAAWHRDGQEAAVLYRGTRLVAALAWAKTHRTDLSTTATAFLDAARRHHRSRNRIRRGLTIGTSAVTALTLVLGTLFIYAQHQSAQQRALANSRALAQASQDQSRYDPAESVLLAMAAYKTSPTPEARNQLLRQYLAYGHSDRIFSGMLGNVASFSTSQDGDVVFAGTVTGRATLFLQSSAGLVRNYPVSLPGQYVFCTVVTADGRRAGFLDEDGSAGWFDVNPAAAEPVGPVHKLPAVLGFAPYGNSPRDALAISTDGKLMALNTGSRLAWWDLDKGTIAGISPRLADLASGLWISPDSKTLLVENLPLASNYPGLLAVDMATGSSRTVVQPTDDQEFLVSGDRTAVALCQDQSDGSSIVTLHRISDGSRLGATYRSATDAGDLCLHLDAADASGRTIVATRGSREDQVSAQARGDVGQPPIEAVIDLDRGAEASFFSVQHDISVFSQDLVSKGGKLFLSGHGVSDIAYTEVPSGAGDITVANQILTRDGRKVINLLYNGTLQLWSAGAKYGDKPLAQSPGPDPKWDDLFTYGDTSSPGRLTMNDKGDLFADLEDANIVVVRDTSTLRPVARIAAAEPPNAGVNESAFSYFFDAGGHLLTISGTQVQQWDERAGRLLAHFDATVFHPKQASDGNPAVEIHPGPEAGQIAVAIGGDPMIKVVDLATGAMTGGINVTTGDATGIRFDASGRYFALLRQGGVIELWSMHPLRRELGPFRSIAADTNVRVLYEAKFIGNSADYFIAANDAFTIYHLDKPDSIDSYEFGHPDGTSQQVPYQFFGSSKDAKVLLYTDEDGIGGPLVLDPASWEVALCDTIGHRTLTPDEKNSLPAPVPKAPLCATGA